MLFSAASFATAESAPLQWGRAQVVRQPVRALRQVRHSAPIRDTRVMAAVWQEDDTFAVQQTAADDRSIVVERAAPVYDPFEEDDRTFGQDRPYQEDRVAQLPDDPFDEPAGEPMPEPEMPEPDADEFEADEPETEEFEADIEEVEAAVEDEIKRRQSAEDLFDDAMEDPSDPFDENSETDSEFDPETDFEDDFLDDDMLEPGEDEDLEIPDFGLEFGRDKEEGYDEADDEPTQAELEKQRKELAREQRESQKSCREELEAIESDKISSIDLSIRVDGNAGKDFPYECAVSTKQHQPRQWPEITYNWKAAALCHKPLYFEQVQLERYGHSWGPYVQPIMSGAHFFGTLPILPYKMGIRTPNECVYALGYYRPGSCAPYMIDPIPFTWRAAFFEGAAATGISFVIP